MAEVRITTSFRDDLTMVVSDRILKDILKTIEMLAIIPSMGSMDAPRSLIKKFGNDVHKIPVGPFDIVTHYDVENDAVTVLGLIHQRAAW